MCNFIHNIVELDCLWVKITHKNGYKKSRFKSGLSILKS